MRAQVCLLGILVSFCAVASSPRRTFEVEKMAKPFLAHSFSNELKRPKNWKSLAPFSQFPIDRDLPTHWDWRELGAVAPIRDQAKPQYCGSCWAFGTVAATEAAIFIHTGHRPHLSEQQLVSCDDNAAGCGGGYFAFDFYTKTGATYEREFPYRADDIPCKKTLPGHEKLSSWAYVGASDREPTTEEMKSAIYHVGPIAVTVSASGAWDDYKSGVYNECNQGPLNHIVAIVGWDDEDQAWIIRNSHGTQWGERGYMRIRYTDDQGNKCNRVGENAAFPIF